MHALGLHVCRCFVTHVLSQGHPNGCFVGPFCFENESRKIPLEGFNCMLAVHVALVYRILLSKWANEGPMLHACDCFVGSPQCRNSPLDSGSERFQVCLLPAALMAPSFCAIFFRSLERVPGCMISAALLAPTDSATFQVACLRFLCLVARLSQPSSKLQP